MFMLPYKSKALRIGFTIKITSPPDDDFLLFIADLLDLKVVQKL